MKIKTKVSRLLFISVMFATLCGCMADTRYLSFTSIEKEGWKRADTLSFCIPPLEDIEDKDIYLLLHTEGYKYENIAIGFSVSQDSNNLYNKQFHYLLGDYSSIKGLGRRCDYKLPTNKFGLCDTIPATITLVHEMEESILSGIHRVGILIEEPAKISWNANWE